MMKLPLWRSSEPKNSEILLNIISDCTEINSEAGDVYREESNFCSSGGVNFENCFTCMGQFVNVTASGK